ncbi:MAG: hypothetical protein JWM18_2616 [Chloroflexi bacterium]|jgi:hypothetical protein|nr:hypothetical protein [Chloroflexota bacterium]
MNEPPSSSGVRPDGQASDCLQGVRVMTDSIHLLKPDGELVEVTVSPCGAERPGAVPT